jgi:hypothetical protein
LLMLPEALPHVGGGSILRPREFYLHKTIGGRGILDIDR